MCAQCLTNTEFAVANAALIAAALKKPVHRALASVGIAREPLTVARDARTVEFLRALEVDPVDALGASAVRAADEWVAFGGHERLEDERRARAASWARPIGSHSRLAPQ
jgi:hypothetical protein